MSFWNAVVIIVAIVAFANIRMAKIQARGGTTGRLARFGQHAPLIEAGAQPSPRELELEREVENLRERIHVLERIATDANQTRTLQTQALAAEIESLRDR